MTENNVRVDYVAPNSMFWRVLSAHRKQSVEDLQKHFSQRCIVAFDPGETTGVTVWEGNLERFELFQLETKDVCQAFDMLAEVLAHFNPDHLRVEEYRVYNWMADQHSWSSLHTPQLIGAIKVLAYKLSIPLTFKLAQHAKATWNDDILKACHLYSPGLKHARDAERHALLYMSHPLAQDSQALPGPTTE